MIIEFYGLSGSGKTTLANKIEKEGDFKVVRIQSLTELIFYNFLFAANHPFKYIAIFVYLVLNSNFSLKMFYYKFMNTFLHHNAKYQKALGCKRAIIDQGHFQNILAVFEKPVEKDALMRYLKFLPKPDALILFDVSEEEIKKSPREDFGGEYFKKWKKIIQENNKLFLSIIGDLNLNYFILKKPEDWNLIYEKLH